MLYLYCFCFNTLEKHKTHFFGETCLQVKHYSFSEHQNSDYLVNYKGHLLPPIALYHGVIFLAFSHSHILNQSLI